MKTWACLDSNNMVVNCIVADNEEIAFACSHGLRVTEYTETNPIGKGWVYLENGEWEQPIIETYEPEIIPITE